MAETRQPGVGRGGAQDVGAPLGVDDQLAEAVDDGRVTGVPLAHHVLQQVARQTHPPRKHQHQVAFQ